MTATYMNFYDMEKSSVNLTVMGEGIVCLG